MKADWSLFWQTRYRSVSVRNALSHFQSHVSDWNIKGCASVFRRFSFIGYFWKCVVFDTVHNLFLTRFYECLFQWHFLFVFGVLFIYKNGLGVQLVGLEVWGRCVGYYYMHANKVRMHAKMTHYVHLENMRIYAPQCQFLRTNSM